ncbi:acyl carrier protein [Streptomyces sp. TLI_185]|uniref:acyl carrier protein n=1 Tax=Streptomyces sp. TLI_185 TaxID=2485151 RepID=UPI000F9DA15F|nr:acyl carrier protein [Streptomyces sp. TLI_185]RPF24894.1 act minimal PKS acyl carrier protein [Streptomyces sp. TLI_185]
MLSLDGLVATIRRCAGDSDVAALDGDILDVSYQDLGYDSVAVLEIFAELGSEHGIAISDEEVFETMTPRQTLDLVNSRTVSA